MSNVIPFTAFPKVDLRDLFVSVAHGFYIMDKEAGVLKTYNGITYDVTDENVQRVIDQARIAEARIDSLREEIEDVVEQQWEKTEEALPEQLHHYQQGGQFYES